DLLERELHLALLVPVEDETLASLRDDDGRLALLAAVPARLTVAARARGELAVVGEPLLQLVGFRQRLPDLVRRCGKDDLAHDLHGSSNPQPDGCVYLGATNELHFTRRSPCHSSRWWSSRT